MTVKEIKYKNLANLISELMLTSPSNILKNGRPVVERGMLMHSLRSKVSLPKIGVVTISSVYVSGAKEVVMLMTLNDKQLKILRDNRVIVGVKKRSDPINSGEYYCFLTKYLVERIDSM